jgi:ribonuclease D
VLPPLVLVAGEEGLAALVAALAEQPIVSVDTESNSMHAYRERVCLMQFSTPAADYIVDPIRLNDLSALAPLFANPAQQKIFHAGEYDIICLRRDYRFDVVNIFDTMSAARTLGWPQVGLAAILERQFGVKMSKEHQRADWKRRPLSAAQLEYARMDTHYLLALRELQLQALIEAGRVAEAEEEFARLARLGDDVVTRTPSFWRVKGARDLPPAQAALLQALFAYREQQAERIDQPPFKVMGEATLLELVRRAPRQLADLQGVPGMTPDQIRRHGRSVLDAIAQGLTAAPPPPPEDQRLPDDEQDRYDRLHTWRKEKARARGVESDVIISRAALSALARRVPRTPAELEQIAELGPWRRATYGEELLALLAR